MHNVNHRVGLRHRIEFGMLLAIAIGTVLACADASSVSAQNVERLRQLDRDGDGKLSQDEISKTLWERVSRHDVDGDGKLDAAERQAAGLNADETKSGRRPGGAPVSFSVHTFTGPDGHTLRYSLFVPKDRAEGEELPVVLCLHGRGGNTEAPLALSREELRKKHPCIIVAPGIDGAKERWVGGNRVSNQQRVVMMELMGLLDVIIKTHDGDANRVYVTGQSMGGVGTWGLIAAHAERFAAAVPVCGIWNVEDAEKMKNVPVWAFHGADDATVPVSGSRDMIAAIKAAGGAPKYTEFPGVGHGSWSQAYATAEMWEWMFAQKRTAK